MSNPKKIEQLTEATTLHDNDLVFASVLGVDDTYVSKKVTLADIANYVRNGMIDIPDGSGFGGEVDPNDSDPEPIVVPDDDSGQTEEPVSFTKSSISGAATCTANTSSSSTSFTLDKTQKTPDDASLQYAISTSKTPTPTSWTNTSITNNKLTLSITFTEKTTQTKYLFIKVSKDGHEESIYYVGINQTYNESTSYSTTYSTKTQQIIASSAAAATYQRNLLVAAHPEWVSPSGIYGSHNIWYFTYQQPTTTPITTQTYGHSISEQLTLVS